MEKRRAARERCVRVPCPEARGMARANPQIARRIPACPGKFSAPLFWRRTLLQSGRGTFCASLVLLRTPKRGRARATPLQACEAARQARFYLSCAVRCEDSVVLCGLQFADCPANQFQCALRLLGAMFVINGQLLCGLDGGFKRILRILREPVSYTHLRAHETGRNLVCRLLLEKKKQT